MVNNGWLDQCNVTALLELNPRFTLSEVLHNPSGKSALVYQYRLDASLNEDVAWNDFYIQMDMLKRLEQVGALSLLSYGQHRIDEGVSSYFVAVEKPSQFRRWDQAYPDILRLDLSKRIRIWMDLVEHIAQIHGILSYHGRLCPEDVWIELAEKGGRANYIFPGIQQWRMKQFFSLEEDWSCCADYTTRTSMKKSYRSASDDRYASGCFLFTLVFPGKSIPDSDQALHAYESECDSGLFTILSALWDSVKETPLSVILEMANRYLSQKMDEVVWTVGWHADESAGLLQRSDLSREEWEQRFWTDAAPESYLYSRFDSQNRRMLLYVIGSTYEWIFQVNAGKQGGPDLIIQDCGEKSPFERERAKERAKRFRGGWTFDRRSDSKTSGISLLEYIKSESIMSNSKRAQNRQTREVFDQWEDVLRLQLERLNADDKRYAYREWRLIEDGSVLEVQLLVERQLSFAAGTEMMFVTDKAQHPAGRYIRQEGNKVYLETVRDYGSEELPELGDLCENTQREKIQLNRQRQVLQQFRMGRKINRLLLEHLVEPAHANTYPASTISTYQNVNQDQKLALQAALGAESIFVLQGPPGTGKTTWITELMLQIYRREPKARILLASQSNVAIDHAFSKFMKIVEQHAHEFRQAPIAVRIGNEKIGESVQQWTIDPALQRWVEHLEDNVDGKIWSIMDRIQDPARYNRVLDIYNDWKTMFGKEDEMKPLFLAQSPTLIGATCMGSYPLYQWDLSFDWVIIDEAGRATPPESLLPSINGKKVVFVGDHKQLPPVIDRFLDEAGEDKLKINSLKVSLFEDLFKRIHTDSRATLQTQYRMHPAIARMVSALFYSDTPLKPGCTEEERASGIYDWKPITWIRTDDHQQAAEKQLGTSYFNLAEVNAVQNALLNLDKCLENTGTRKSVAVITGYMPQRNKLREAIDVLNLEHLEVEVDTVDAFQGREADLVLYSMVRNNSERNLGFLRDERRMNVALSRARELLVMIGSTEMARGLTPQHIVRGIYDYIATDRDAAIRSWKELQP